MITAFLTGNFGNNLAGIVSSKCIALDLGYEWGVNPSPKYDYHNGMIQTYFLDIDYGKFPENIQHEYYEKEIRYNHEGDNVDVRIFDKNVYNIKDNTILLGGVWQSYGYFEKYRNNLYDWLKIKEEYVLQYEELLRQHNIILDDNMCVINFRGGEYSNYNRLMINPKYYIDCVHKTLLTNPLMKFIIITDDVHRANQYIPNIPAYHFDIGLDYYIINKSKYCILSNSSFPIFSILTNKNVKKVFAPKYWARHNVSNGYWAIGDQYYPGIDYVDRNGNVFDYEQCKEEANIWRTTHL